MAARASVDAMSADGSDRVHVVGTLRLCRSIRAPPFPRLAARRMIPHMKVALTVARLAYVVVGLTALVIGRDLWEAAESSAGLVLVGGVLALAGAAWVTSAGLVRGAIASVGIVVGASMVAMTSFMAAYVIGVYFGDPARGALLATPIPVALASAWIMWRMSRRPWDRAPSA
jgi:hypothetical protein